MAEMWRDDVNQHYHLRAWALDMLNHVVLRHARSFPEVAFVVASWRPVCLRGGNTGLTAPPSSTLSPHRTILSLAPKRSTMKVYQLTLLSVSSGNPAKAAVLGSAQDLSSFSMFQRGSIAQFMSFFAQVRSPKFTRGLTKQTVAERTPPNQPSSVEENGYKAHIMRIPGRTANSPGMAGESTHRF